MRAPGLLLRWELLLGTWSVGFNYLFIFPPGYFALWDSNTHHRPAGESVSWCLETSLFFKSPFPRRISVPSSFVSLFIFCPTSFQRLWAAFLDAWYPLSAFRSCFVEFARCSNVLSMNLWGRKWSPHPIPPPSEDRHLRAFFMLAFNLVVKHLWCSQHICGMGCGMGYSPRSTNLPLSTFIFKFPEGRDQAWSCHFYILRA